MVEAPVRAQASCERRAETVRYFNSDTESAWTLTCGAILGMFSVAEEYSLGSQTLRLQTTILRFLQTCKNIQEPCKGPVMTSPTVSNRIRSSISQKEKQ